MRYTVIGILVLGLLLNVLPLNGKTYKGVTMEDKIEADGNTLILNGMALRKKLWVKVYVAGLYLPAKETDGDKVLKADEPRRTVMHFVYDVSAKKINGAWIDGLEDNTPNYSPQLKKQFDTLCEYMEDVDDGQQLMFTYIPGKGTEVKVKGKVKGVIEGKAFADALWACWIGPKPGPGESFKEGLLGI